MNSIQSNLQQIQNKIQNKNITLIAVTKTRSIEEIKKAINSGVKIIAENRVQEAFQKYYILKDFLKQNNIEFHFIGHLQRNKVKLSVQIFDLIQSVDSQKLANEINKHSLNINKIQRILLQVNIGNESQKSGCSYEIK